jgi:hypothetical protein
MKTHVIEREADSRADPATVFALLSDALTWPTWSPLGAAEIEVSSPAGPGGVGEVRRFDTGRYSSHEEVVVADAPDHFAYALLAGLPLRDYRADIRITPVADGCHISWRSTFGAKVPGTGWIFRRRLGAFIGDVVDGLAARASASVAG